MIYVIIATTIGSSIPIPPHTSKILIKIGSSLFRAMLAHTAVEDRFSKRSAKNADLDVWIETAA